MPFTNFALYYRTGTTTISTNIDPASLPASQVIHFNDKNARCILMKKQKQNNNSYDPTITPNGEKFINVQTNGAMFEKYVIQFEFTRNDPRLSKLEGFFELKQKLSGTLDFGIFGISHPNSVHYSKEATPKTGVTLFDYESIDSMGEVEIATITVIVAGDLKDGKTSQ